MLNIAVIMPFVSYRITKAVLSRFKTIVMPWPFVSNRDSVLPKHSGCSAQTSLVLGKDRKNVRHNCL